MGLGGSYQNGKTEIAAFLKNTLYKGANILDVGAGGGTYRYYLGDDYAMDAVEVWHESVEELQKSYDSVYEKDIRDFRYEKTYDLVIFGDVLEHLSVEDAKRVLNEAKTHSKAIMVAVPYMYEQEALYGNEAEVHLQPDLTHEIFNERYPGFERVVAVGDIYGYYYMKTGLNRDVKLCSYSICKNEKKFIDKWFENVFCADYICVLDTGSTDGTWEILQELQAKYPGKVIVKQETISPWRFDVARNKSMEIIPEDAEILVSTDFDELFSEGWADLIREHWLPGVTNRCYYNYAWSHNSAGECTDMFVYDKCHTRDMHWIYPVHEVLWPVSEDREEHAIDLTKCILLEHFPDKEKPRKFYFDLLRLAVEENPDNPHERMLLAREYLINGEYEKALEEYKTTIDMQAIDEPMYRNVLLESLGRCADCYKILKNFDEAIWYCQEFVKEDRTYREPYLIMAEMYNLMEMPTLAKAMALTAFKYGTRKYSWVERANTWTDWGYDVLSVAESKLGEYEEALKHVNMALKHNPDDMRLLKNKIAIMEALDKSKNIS